MFVAEIYADTFRHKIYFIAVYITAPHIYINTSGKKVLNTHLSTLWKHLTDVTSQSTIGEECRHQGTCRRQQSLTCRCLRMQGWWESGRWETCRCCRECLPPVSPDTVGKIFIQKKMIRLLNLLYNTDLSTTSSSEGQPSGRRKVSP